MKRIGYVRTSTSAQHTDRQVNALNEICDKVYVEKGVSGRIKKRPILTEAISQLNEGDELIVHSYDRAFRNVVEGLTILDQLTEHGIKFSSITQGFDPTSPEGRLFFIIILALAEFEVLLLSKRTIQGLEAARKRGKFGGRPRGGDSKIPCKDKNETLSAAS